MELFNTRGYDSVYEDMLASYPSVAARVFSKKSVFEAIPVLGSASDYLATRKVGESSACTVVNAAQGGCLGYPGVMLVASLPDTYEAFLEELAGERPSPKCSLSDDGSRVEAWLCWNKHSGGRCVGFQVMPELIQEMIEKVDDLVGARRNSMFVKMNPVYVPLVLMAGESLAFGGFWYDGFLDEEVHDHRSYAFNHEPPFESSCDGSEAAVTQDSEAREGLLFASLAWIAPLPEFLVGGVTHTPLHASQVCEEDI